MITTRLRLPSQTSKRYVRIPRLSGLALSAAGDRLVTTVAELDSDGGRYISSLWSLDPTGDGPARRLTRSEKGESSPAFASDGSLLFVSERPRPGGKDDDPAGVWRLPPGGGEPWPVATHPGGISAVTAAKRAPVVVFAAKVAPGERSSAEEESWRSDRSTRKITAILAREPAHPGLGPRAWARGDPLLRRGPARRRRRAEGHRRGPRSHPRCWPSAARTPPRCSMRTARRSSVNGRSRCLVGRVRTDVVRIEVGTGARTVLASDAEGDWSLQVAGHLAR